MFNRILYNTYTHHTLPIGQGLVHCTYRPSMRNSHTISSSRVYPNPCFDAMEMVARFLIKSLKAKRNKSNTVKAIYRKIRTGGVSVRSEYGAYEIIKHYKEIPIDPKFYYRRGVVVLVGFNDIFFEDRKLLEQWVILNKPSLINHYHFTHDTVDEKPELDKTLVIDMFRLYNLTIEDHYVGIE